MPKKAMLISVETVRDRQDIAKAILFSIKQNNPDYIIFLASDISREETLPLITDNLNIPYEQNLIYEIMDKACFQRSNKTLSE